MKRILRKEFNPYISQSSLYKYFVILSRRFQLANSLASYSIVNCYPLEKKSVPDDDEETAAL